MNTQESRIYADFYDQIYGSYLKKEVERSLDDLAARVPLLAFPARECWGRGAGTGRGVP